MLNVKSIIKEELISKESFKTFAEKRLAGAEKITKSSKEKGGPAMLTYHHFVVKLPYYKKASEGNFDIKEGKEEFKELLDKLCKVSNDVNIGQVEFQKLLGQLEVLGELIIKNK
jgi:hypothetical protein